MRKLALSIPVAVLLAVPATAATPTVKVKDNFFKPKKVTIHKGGKVTWRWKGSNPHDVALEKPGSATVSKRSAIKTSGSFTYKFRRTGTWHVLCEVHPTHMRMKVVVNR